MKSKLLLLFAFVLGACQPVADAAPTHTVKLVAPNKRDAVAYDVALAHTPAKRSRGLMYRREMPAAQGMLFIWPRQDNVKMWMKNTLIPLDVFFIRDRKIVAVERNMRPHDLTPRGPGTPVDMVLELNAGQAEQYGIGRGWTVQILGDVPKAK